MGKKQKLRIGALCAERNSAVFDVWINHKQERKSMKSTAHSICEIKSIYNRKVLFVTFLLIYGSRSVFMGIHGSRLVIHSSRLVLMVFIGSRLVFHVSRLVVHGFS